VDYHRSYRSSPFTDKHCLVVPVVHNSTNPISREEEKWTRELFVWRRQS
jgi:hypothetical protein